MDSDWTRGRRDDSRPGKGERSGDRRSGPREARSDFRQREDRGGFGQRENRSDYRRDDAPRERGPRSAGENQSWRPFRPARDVDDDRGGERTSFRDRERPFERRDERPRERPWEDRPARGGYEDRQDRPGRSFRDAAPGDRPSYRQGRGGYRPFDRPFDERGGGRDAGAGGGRPFGRRDEERGGYPRGERRWGEERPENTRRPRHEDEGPFAGQGRPLGTSTRLGRSPVQQFERVQADVYGRWPVLESLRAGNVIRVYLAAGVRDTADHLREIQTLAADRHIPVVRVDRFALDKALGNANHQGIAAACKPFDYTNLDDLLEKASTGEGQPLVVLFDGVQDPQNLGSILRTAEAAGADGAVLPKHHQAGITPAVVRASAGAVEHLPVAEVTNLRASIEKIKEAGYWLVGLDMEGGTDYDNFDVDSPIALVVGGEGKGLSRVVTEQCDYLVRLPMRGAVGSLNASVAAGIVLYEIDRRRAAAGLTRLRRADRAAKRRQEETPTPLLEADPAVLGDPEHDLAVYTDEAEEQPDLELDEDLDDLGLDDEEPDLEPEEEADPAETAEVGASPSAASPAAEGHGASPETKEPEQHEQPAEDDATA